MPDEMPRYVRVELLVPLLDDERSPDDWDWTTLCESELPLHCPRPAVPVAPDDPDLDVVRALLDPARLFDREHDFGPDGEAAFCAVCGADSAGSFAAAPCGGMDAATVRGYHTDEDVQRGVDTGELAPLPADDDEPRSTAKTANGRDLERHERRVRP